MINAVDSQNTIMAKTNNQSAIMQSSLSHNPIIRPAPKKAVDPKVRAIRITVKTVLYLFMTLGAIVCIYPLIYTFLAAFFSAEDFWNLYRTGMPFFPIPTNPTWHNYAMFLKADSEVFLAFANSLFRTGYNVILGTMMAFITGFCFARLRFKGKKAIFMVMLAISMLPSTITLAPTFLMYRFLNIYDTYWVYVLGGPTINIMGGFMVMLAFENIPRDVDDAAKIDGAGYWRTMWRILFPLQIPILTYLAIGTAIGTWNDWFTPFYFTESAALQTLPSAITKLSSAGGILFPDYPAIIALSLGTTIPPLIIFFIFQRYIIEGIGNIGVKG